MIRRITRIEYAAGQFLELPPYRSEQETAQELYRASSPLTGANYEYDMLGKTPAPKKNAIERMAFTFVGTAGEVNAGIDELRAKLYNGARFKVWTEGSEEAAYDDDEEISTSRWAYGRIMAQPSITLDVTNRNHAPVICIVERFGDWNAEDLIEEEIAISGANPGSITVVNPGTAPVMDAVIIIKGVFADTILSNLANGRQLQSTRAGAGANDWLKYDAGNRSVEYSSNGGVTWAGDYENFVRVPPQIQLGVIEVGSNEIEQAGIEDGFLYVAYYPKFH